MSHVKDLVILLVCGVTKQDFKMPRGWSVTCHAKPSLFAYPKKLEDKKEEKKERVTTVTLSTTAKVNQHSYTVMTGQHDGICRESCTHKCCFGWSSYCI